MKTASIHPRHGPLVSTKQSFLPNSRPRSPPSCGCPSSHPGRLNGAGRREARVRAPAASNTLDRSGRGFLSGVRYSDSIDETSGLRRRARQRVRTPASRARRRNRRRSDDPRPDTARHPRRDGSPTGESSGTREGSHHSDRRTTEPLSAPNRPSPSRHPVVSNRPPTVQPLSKIRAIDSNSCRYHRPARPFCLRVLNAIMVTKPLSGLEATSRVRTHPGYFS